MIAANLRRLTGLLCLVLASSTLPALAGPAGPEIAMPSAFKQLKPGLWESVDETTGEGGPGADPAQMQAMMADRLAKMPPEQRAQIEAMMKKQMEANKGGKHAMTHKTQSCLHQADLDRGTWKMEGFDKNDECKFKEVGRSSNSLTLGADCSSRVGDTSNRDEGLPGDTSMAFSAHTSITIQVQSPTSTTTVSSTVGTVGKNPMKQEVKSTAHWVAAACGNVK